MEMVKIQKFISDGAPVHKSYNAVGRYNGGIMLFIVTEDFTIFYTSLLLK